MFTALGSQPPFSQFRRKGTTKNSFVQKITNEILEVVFSALRVECGGRVGEGEEKYDKMFAQVRNLQYFCAGIETMQIRNTLYRVWSYAIHWLTAWNTGGEGIHSPKLFYIVRMLLYDTNSYYAWDKIETQREAMLHAPKPIHVEDYGTGQSGTKLIQDIAKTSLCSVKEGRMYFRLVNYLSHEKKTITPDEPLCIIELGTSLGISTAYLATSSVLNHVITCEGSHELIEMSKRNWHKLGIENVTCVEANIDETLADTLKYNAHARVDFALIDANHTREATLRYFDQLAHYAGESTIIAVDDIHYSHEMNEAWQEIKRRKDVTTTMDLYECGLVFFDHHYLKKHYKLRL